MRRKLTFPASPALSPRFTLCRTIALVVALLLVAYEAYAIFLAPGGVPANAPASDSFVAGEIAGARTISQTLLLGTGGFEAVAVGPRQVEDSPAGLVVFELREVEAGSERTYYRVAVPVAEVLAAGTYWLRLPKIDASAGRTYRLAISMPETPPGSGIGLLANRHDTYPGGTMFVDDREQWGDLVFDTRSSRATLFGNLEYALRNRPPLLRSRTTLGALLLLYNLALLTVVYYLVRCQGDSGQTTNLQSTAKQPRLSCSTLQDSQKSAVALRTTQAVRGSPEVDSTPTGPSERGKPTRVSPLT